MIVLAVIITGAVVFCVIMSFVVRGDDKTSIGQRRLAFCSHFGLNAQTRVLLGFARGVDKLLKLTTISITG